MTLLHNTRVTLDMIKWEHSFLTLPFGLTGAVIAANGVPSLRTLGWICVAMVAARSAAMAFNRLVDADIDALNPRTAVRALPAGLLTRQFVLCFTIAASALLFFAAWMLNPLAFYLSPLALIIVCAYSYTKRFTRWAHLFLGFAMGIAPAAAWVAVRGTLDPRVLIVTAAVMFWGEASTFSIAARIIAMTSPVDSTLYLVPSESPELCALPAFSTSSPSHFLPGCYLASASAASQLPASRSPESLCYTSTRSSRPMTSAS